jgi:hypothetical protein
METNLPIGYLLTWVAVVTVLPVVVVGLWLGLEKKK